MLADLSGRIFNQYQLVDVIGRGGMAVVYRAHQLNIERTVAVKVMSASLSNEADFLTRFQREAELIARLEHPNILPIYDYGNHEEYLYIVLRLMEGGSLDQLIANKPLPFGDVERMVTQIASALDMAHEHSVVHRDLKPNNILLDRLSNAYLMDFGIAKVVSDAHVTTTTTLMGTPGYMAPEQWKMAKIDHRADIYSLGILTYELLTGSTPFIGQTPLQYMYAHLHEQIPQPSNYVYGLPSEVDKVLFRATAKDPKRRYSSAGEFAAAFAAAIEGVDDRQSDTNVSITITDGDDPKVTDKPGIQPVRSLLDDMLVDLELRDKDPTEPRPKVDLAGAIASSPSDTTHRLPKQTEPSLQLHDLLMGLEDISSDRATKSFKVQAAFWVKEDATNPKRPDKLDSLLDDLAKTPEESVQRHLKVVDLAIYGGKSQGSLGVKVQQVRLPPSLSEQLGQDTGLMLLGIDETGPGARAGLFLGDILIAIDDEPLRFVDSMTNHLSHERIGQTVTLHFVRAGHLYKVDIMVEEQN